MRTIIAGSRTCTYPKALYLALRNCGWRPTVVLSGGARGADTLGELWAKANRVPVERYIPDWGKYGRGAGYRRNTTMAENADALIALWNGTSGGTKHMVKEATRLGLRVFVLEYSE